MAPGTLASAALIRLGVFADEFVFFGQMHQQRRVNSLGLAAIVLGVPAAEGIKVNGTCGSWPGSPPALSVVVILNNHQAMVKPDLDSTFAFAQADCAFDACVAPRTRSTRPSESAGSASPRQATCWSGRTSTSLWR